jgi:hypothetical protein
MQCKCACARAQSCNVQDSNMFFMVGAVHPGVDHNCGECRSASARVNAVAVCVGVYRGGGILYTFVPRAAYLRVSRPHVHTCTADPF